jgi:RNA polymerase sigma-B factor
VTSATATCERTPPESPERRSHRGPTGYEHIAPLLAEFARLAPDHPRRQLLRQELVIGYLPVAQHIARKHAYRGENLDDLEQVAAVGLVQAVDRFDPDRGVDFLAFAVPTINGEVLRHYRDRTAAIRTPRRLRDLQRKVSDTAQELGQRLGRTPRLSEICTRLNVDCDTVAQALYAGHATHCTSLDEPFLQEHPGEGTTRLDAALGCIDHELSLVDDRQSLAPLLAALPDRERQVVSLRFFDDMTNTEIAEWVGVSQAQVSRLLATTLRGLRRRLVEEPGYS